jgi:ProP effector
MPPPPQGPDRTPHATDTAAVEPAVAAPPPSPEQIAENEARRARATLLRAYESSTLSRANFCVLKGLNEAALEAQLVLARAERPAQPPAPERSAGASRPGAPGTPGGGGRREGRDAHGPRESRGPRRPPR